MHLPDWRRCLIATALAVPLLTAPAAAAPESVPDTAARTAITTKVTDRNDTAGPLDIVQVRHRVVSDGDRTRLAFTVRTQGDFDNSELSWRHRHLILEMDRDGQPGAERNVTIFSRDGVLRADLISNATREAIAHLAVVRPDPWTVRVMGPRRLLGVRKVFWTSNYHRDASPRCGWTDDGHPITCQDSAPNRGWLRLDRMAWPESGGSV